MPLPAAAAGVVIVLHVVDYDIVTVLVSLWYSHRCASLGYTMF
jgi:hypothetical protein